MKRALCQVRLNDMNKNNVKEFSRAHSLIEIFDYRKILKSLRDASTSIPWGLDRIHLFFSNKNKPHNLHTFILLSSLLFVDIICVLGRMSSRSIYIQSFSLAYDPELISSSQQTTRINRGSPTQWVAITLAWIFLHVYQLNPVIEEFSLKMYICVVENLLFFSFLFCLLSWRIFEWSEGRWTCIKSVEFYGVCVEASIALSSVIGFSGLSDKK